MLPDDETADAVAYEEVTKEEYAKQASSFDAEEAADGSAVLRGSCPRCHHITEHTIAADVTTRPWSLWPSQRREVTPPAVAGSQEDPIEQMCCLCDADHVGRPASYRGCGAYWDLVVSRR